MLYLVSTPIGNLGDISERAKKTLENVDLIACEDTRTSKQLFSLLGLSVIPPLTPYHEHNADTVRPRLLEKLKKGVSIALVSDAGTPLVSDPGYKLVRACREQGIQVTTVPGANAVLSALQLSGLPSDSFFFKGFLPPKTHARQQLLRELETIPATLIFYETSHRLIEMLSDLRLILGDRETAVVREITKKFEETKNGLLSELIDYYTQEGAPKGELVVVVDRYKKTENAVSAEDLTALIQKTLQDYSVRDTVERIVSLTGLNKRDLYKKVLEIKENGGKNGL